MYPLVGGQWCYGWMNISQTLLIRKWGAGTSTPTMVRRFPPPWAVNRDCVERPDTTSTWQEQRRDLNRELGMEIAKRWQPCSHRQNKRRSEPATKQTKTQNRGNAGKLSIFSWGKQAFSQNDIRARNFKNNIDRPAYRERKFKSIRRKP